jgi:hypothetical protein
VSSKTYPIDVALTVASGKFLCGDFGLLHEAVTDLAGWPVMSHHMANEELMDGVADKVIRQVPWMPGAIENMPSWSALARDEVELAIRCWFDTLRAAHGDTVTIELGEPLPVLGLFAGLERIGTAS